MSIDSNATAEVIGDCAENLNIFGAWRRSHFDYDFVAEKNKLR